MVERSNRHGYDTRSQEHAGAVMRAARCTLLHLCSCRGVSVVCVVSVSVFLFRVRGMSAHTVSETRSGEKSPPLAPIPNGRDSVHFPRTVLVPTSPSVDRERSRAKLFPLGSFFQ